MCYFARYTGLPAQFVFFAGGAEYVYAEAQGNLAVWIWKIHIHRIAAGALHHQKLKRSVLEIRSGEASSPD